jgi:NAD-dependent SIR2 family protein deacetylase
MDIICTNCGEPYDTDYILHDAPEEFKRNGCLITACPCCEDRTSPLSTTEKQRLQAIAEVAPLFGDDIDGFAAFLEDMSYIG